MAQQKLGVADPMELVDQALLPACGPERPWRDMFDFLEACSGRTAPLSRAMARAGLVVGPQIDITLHAVWDVRQSR
eukprot:4503197-Alexandrium_andersonii.AAC.1